MTYRISTRMALAALALLAACDSPTGSGGGRPAAATVVSGDLQTQTVGKALVSPLVVKVTDANGNPARGQVVSFVVTAGGGSVDAGPTVTDRDGQATSHWTLGTAADTQRVEVRVMDASNGGVIVAAAFRAIATPDAPSSIVAQGPSAFTGLPLLPLADSVAALVRDAYGNPVPGAAVVWTVIKGGGSVSPGTSNTGSTGVARTSWTLGAQLDSLQIIEAAAGLTLKTQFTANGHVPGDAVVVKVSGEAQVDTAGQVLPQPLVVRVQRANGTPVAGIPVTFTLPAGSGSVSPATAVSNGSGQVSVQWTLGPAAGAMSATASIASGSSTTFHATAVLPRAVYMRFLAPRPDTIAGDSVRVTVAVDSANASVSSVVARAGGNSVTLQPGGFPGQVTGVLSLMGVPRGPVDLRVTATTVNGDSATITRGIIHDTPPVVTSTNPLNGTVARPDLRVDADCADDDPAGCASMAVTVRNLSGGSDLAQVASGTTSIHTTLSLAAYDQAVFVLVISGTDSRGQKRFVIDTVAVESSPVLTEAGSGGARMLDADSSRLLFRDNAGSLFVRSGGLDSLVKASAYPDPRFTFLHSYGAAFATGPFPPQGYDWHAGTLVSLGQVNAELQATGAWAIWSNGTSLYRRDLAAGTSQLVATDANNYGNDVAADGTVAYGTTGSGSGAYDIYRFSGGSPTPITADVDAVSWNVYPVTDGSLFLYYKTNQHGAPTLQNGRIAMWKAGVETLLSDSFTVSVEPHQYYEAENGWVAYLTHDGGGLVQAHVIAPDGTDRLASSTTATVIRGLSGEGTLVYASGGALYATRAPYTSRVRIGHDWPHEAYGRVRFRGPELLLLLGRTAFRVSY